MELNKGVEQSICSKEKPIFWLFFTAYFFFRFITFRKDLRPQKTLFLFGLFFILAGATHLINVWAPWYPVYSLQVFFKLILASFALWSLILLMRVFTAAKNLPAPGHLRDLKEQLQLEQQGYLELQKGQQFVEKEIKKLQEELRFADQQVKREKNDKEQTRKVLEQTKNTLQFLPDAMKEIGEAADFYSALEIGIRKIRETVRVEEERCFRGDGGEAR